MFGRNGNHASNAFTGGTGALGGDDLIIRAKRLVTTDDTGTT